MVCLDLVAPARNVGPAGRGHSDACHDLFEVHRVVAQPRDVIAVNLVTVPAVLCALIGWV